MRSNSGLALYTQLVRERTQQRLQCHQALGGGQQLTSRLNDTHPLRAEQEVVLKQVTALSMQELSPQGK